MLVVVLLSGCTLGPAATKESDGASAPAGTLHAIAPPERLTFAMADGVELVATLWRPEGLDRVPVVLHAQPYASGCSMPGSTFFGDPYPQPCRPPTSDEFWLDEYNGAPRALVENGFAWVDLNVRGTGESGGCLDMNGPTEREDLRVVLDELARAQWSDGNIGMMGLSYMGTTPFVALGHHHPALKAVVAGGVFTNEYYAIYTPQGAGGSVAGAAFAPFWLGSVVGPQLGGGPSAAPEALVRQPERYCPEFVEEFATTAYTPAATEDRNAKHFLDRRHIAQLRDTDAGVLVVQGIPDRAGLQWEPLWDALGDAPKAFVLGEWPHQFPDSDLLSGSPGLDWPALPIAWFDHFLRGGPAPEVLGKVHHQLLGSDEWRTADRWPALTSEVLYVGGTLTATPGSGDLSFRSYPQAAPCGAFPEDAWASMMSDPLPNTTILAGNPMAWLELEVDMPAATVAIELRDVQGDDVCDGKIISTAAADLRFLADPFTGADPPTGEPFFLRVDFYAVSQAVEKGHRLALTFSSSGEMGVSGRPTEATVTIRGGESHILLPMASGIGGVPPGTEYPPMPVGQDWIGS